MQDQFVLRTSVGPLSAGTPVTILVEGEDWADVQTVASMPHVKGLDMLNGRPIITGIRKDALVQRKVRAIVLSTPELKPPTKRRRS